MTTYIILLCVILSLIELIPYFITILFPNICYGCTYLGKTQQALNNSFGLSYINWFAYLILFVIFIYLASKKRNVYHRYSLIFLCLLLIYLPGYPLLNIINFILMIFYKNPPFIKNYSNIFPQSKYIEQHADDIVNEYKQYSTKYNAECLRKSTPGFTIENTNDETKCWRSIILKKCGMIDPSMKPFFPQTTKLLEDKQIHNAFFSILDSDVEIPPHTGYYKGYLRYHLGIIIPNHSSNKAYIVCGDEKYEWKLKEGVVFDDLYLHYVKNPTKSTRVVLYLDIIRPSEHVLVNSLNSIGITYIENHLLFNLFVKNQHSTQKLK